jgi:hypothetical protein
MVIEYNEKLEGRRTIEDDERKQSPCLLGRNQTDKKTKKTKNKQTKKKLNHNSIIMMNFYQLYYHNEKL